jgi:hypothetical protein
MTTGTGSAREIPPGRLSNFEDIPIADAPAPLLPPRRTSKPATAASPDSRGKKPAEPRVRTAESPVAVTPSSCACRHAT